MKKLVFILTTFVALSFNQTATAQNTIVDAAVSNENFSTLVAALKAADLVGALQGDGPFTVFAPTNDAFAKIDQDALANLLKPENKKALTNILTYHVIPANLMASDVVAALKKGNGKVEVKALNGTVLTVMQKDGKIWLKDQAGNYSEITATDVKGSNGVIHVIDTVVMPN
ncbi:fasciclin domain-containing protein [Winogradskyella alexanderae]|uniref:Fasciclin domain-containing protein n=1 Tax=Winogradskyella alexanderae TaxID=2877123 RepID=A0ABS7XUJ7_9FLAO|nr:fasciclin domain-containing protein [Winogradskyella alexanderae]MCA0133698.1 fasciclin domain-containing protein [Winogradskyella alexanderae]